VHGVPRSPALSAVTRPGSKSVASVFHQPSRPVVLIVDDDDGVREALHLILDDSYAVLDVADGRTALSLIRERRVDLVLLDILMPDIDGIEILQELRSFEPHMPVIMMTAVRTVLTAVAAMKLGAADYITKPFAEANLLAAIHAALERRRGPRIVPGDLKPVGPAPHPARSQRVLLVEGDVGWRATIAVALERVARVETAPTLGEALNQVLRLRPTCIVLNVRRSSAEAARFLGAVHAQLPACPVLVISEDPHLQATLAWESLNIRGVLQPPIDAGDLVREIAAIAAPLGEASRPWPQLSRSIGHAIDHLGVHFGNDLSVDGLAEIVGISGSHLAHLFRAETGMTVRDYLNRVRVEIARDLLSHTDENLAEIAAFVGFFDASHLSRVFHQIRGKRPSAYRRGAGTKRLD
jgi:DNA-binding response OmpR family regulator